MTSKIRIIFAFVLLCVMSSQSPALAGPNLLTNPQFETSALEPPGLEGTLTSPMLPSGWAFEGSAGLFDYGDDRADMLEFSPPRKCWNSPECGGRFIAVSIPASTHNEVCDANVGCHRNPLEDAKQQTRIAYQVNPHWRNAVPVAVNASQNYALSFWVSGELITEGEGATSSVRFYDSLGTPISLVQGPEKRANAATCLNGGSTQPCPWTKLVATIAAPSDAASAVVLLGHTSDLFIGQVRFDSVFFG